MSEKTHASILTSDPILRRIMEKIEVPRIVSTKDLFHDLMGCIIEQQIHYRSTKKIYQRLLDKASIEQLNLENFAQFEEKALPSLKLSMNKIETINAWVEFNRKNNIVWESLSDEEITSTLSKIKGIGKWTIDMILLYTLERSAIFPVDDFHLKQIMIELYQLDPSSKLKARMLDIAQNWGDEKSLAVRYLLEWKKSKKKVEI